MIQREYTPEEVEKMLDCEVNSGMGWLKRKFVRRGHRWVTVLFSNVDKDGKVFWLSASYNYSLVRVAGKELEYIPRYGALNPKNPFPPKPKNA